MGEAGRCMAPPLLQDTLMLHPVQAPSLRHAFELMGAAVLEADSGLRRQILDRARDQDFAGTCFRGDARADAKCETDHVRPAHRVFARVQLPIASLVLAISTQTVSHSLA